MTQPGPTSPIREPLEPTIVPERVPSTEDVPPVNDPPTNPDTPGLPGEPTRAPGIGTPTVIPI